MIIDIEVPAAGESVKEATVSALMVQSGSFVKEDEPILELETDKANMPLNSPKSGRVEILVAEGDDVKVGQVIAKLDTDAKAPNAEPAKRTPDSSEKSGAVPMAKVEVAPKASASASEKKVPSEAPASDKSQRIRENEPVSKAGGEAFRTAPRGEASPSALSLLKKHDIPSDMVRGQGRGGRVLKEDVLNFLKNPIIPPTVLPPTPDMGFSASIPKPIEGGRETRKKMTRVRRTIAERLVRSKQQSAMLTTFNEVDMSAVMSVRSRYKDDFFGRHNVKLGFMSFFVKASVEAMMLYPVINSYIDKDNIVYRNYYDISIAVGTDRGLVVPVLKDCNKLSFADIEKRISDFSKRGREGNLGIDELEGGGFTITNGGIYGSLMSTPIINPPQSAILGMHRIDKRAVVIDDQITIRPMMYLALSYDHRNVDGKEAVSFLIRIKEVLEEPSRLLLSL